MTDISLWDQNKSSYSQINLYPLDPSLTTFLICPSISVLAIILTLIRCLKLGSYKDTLGKMVICLSISDLLYCAPLLIAKVLPTPIGSSTPTCLILTMASSFGLISSAVWAASFAHALLTALRRQSQDLQGMVKYYITLTIMLPLVATGIIKYIEFMTDLEATSTCVHWVFKSDLKLVLFHDLTLLISFILSLYSYLQAIIEVKLIGLEDQSSNESCGVLVYPLIAFICWAPIIVSSLYFKFTSHPIKDAGLYGLYFIMFGQLQGFFHAMSYGGLQVFFAKMFCCCRRTRDFTDYHSSFSTARQTNRGLSLDSYATIFSKMNNTRSDRSPLGCSNASKTFESNSSLHSKI